MRVFFSALIILVLVGCNSTSGEVAVEETTVEFADSVPLVVEVDTIETKVEEEEEEAIDRSNSFELYEVIETANFKMILAP